MRKIVIRSLDDIDNAVAEYVMGWHRGKEDKKLSWDNTAIWYDERGKIVEFLQSYRPSTNILDAYKAFSEAMKKVPQSDVHIEHLDGTGWCCSTCYDEEVIDGKKHRKWEMDHSFQTLQEAMCAMAIMWSIPDNVDIEWAAKND